MPDDADGWSVGGDAAATPPAATGTIPPAAIPPPATIPPKTPAPAAPQASAASDGWTVDQAPSVAPQPSPATAQAAPAQSNDGWSVDAPPVPPVPPGASTQATIEAYHPGLWDRVRSTVANSAVGAAVQQEFPKAAEALGITPTETVNSPTYEQHRQQLVAPEYAIPADSHGAAANVTRGALSVVGGLTTPESMALLAIPGGEALGLSAKGAETFGRVLAGGFAGQQIVGLIRQVPELRRRIESGDSQGAEELLGSMGVSAAATSLAAAHSLGVFGHISDPRVAEQVAANPARFHVAPDGTVVDMKPVNDAIESAPKTMRAVPAAAAPEPTATASGRALPAGPPEPLALGAATTPLSRVEIPTQIAGPKQAIPLRGSELAQAPPAEPAAPAVPAPEASAAPAVPPEPPQPVPHSAAPDQTPQVPAQPIGSVAAGTVGPMAVADLAVAPEKFQYKLDSGGRGGVSNLLKSTETFNPSLAGTIGVWTDPADGKTYVVNGHHRFELAQRTNTPSVNVYRMDAANATEARAIGALQNISEGRGTPLDAAKFFRDSGITPEQLRANGISMGEATAQKGVALSGLDESLFNRVVQGSLRPGRALAVAEATSDPAEQRAIMKLAEGREANGKSVPDDVLAEMARLVKSSGQHTETQDTLFGPEQVVKSLAFEKGDISAYIKRQIAADRRLFSAVSSETKAARLGEEGNQIVAGKNAEIAQSARQAEEIYNRLSGYAGPVNDTLEAAAKKMAEGGNADEIKRDTYGTVRRQLEEAVAGRGAGGAAGVQENAGGNGEPAAAEAAPPRLISEEKYQQARKNLAGSLFTSKAGIDPTKIPDLLTVAAYHVENGARDFADWSGRMLGQFGEVIRPHLQALWDRVKPAEQPKPEPAAEAAAGAAKGGAGAAPPVARPPRGAPPPAGGPPPLGERGMAASINLDKLDTADEVAERIRQVVEGNEKAINSQRRGVRSHEETQAAAQHLIDTGLFGDKQAQRVARGRALNAEQGVALGRLMVGQAETVAESQRAYAASPTDQNLYALAAETQKLAAITKSTAGAATEAGRALNAYKILRAAADDPSASNMQNALKILGKQGIDVTRQMAEDLAKIPAEDVQGYRQFLRNAVEVPLKDKLFAYWVANVLSSTRPVLKKGIGDLVASVADVPVKTLAGTIDAIRSKVTGAPREMYSREGLAAAVSGIKAFPDGVRTAMGILRSGLTPEQAAAVELPRYELPGGGKNALNWSGRGFGAITTMFRSIGIRMELGAQATRIAMKEGLRGDALSSRVADLMGNPNQEMIEAATKTGAYNTLTKDADSFLRGLQFFRNSWEPLKYVIPFVKTPYNMLQTGIDFSPAGAAKIMLRAWHDPAYRGSPELMQDAARAALGTMVVGALRTYAENGGITAGVPTDAKERAAFYGAGKQPFSIKIGDRWIPYPFIPTLAVPLTMAAAAANKDNGGGAGVLATLGQMLEKQPVMEGFSNVMNALDDPSRYAKNFAASVLGGFVPAESFLREVTDATDPHVRLADTIAQKIEAGLPIIASDLPAEYDSMGRDIERRGQSGLEAFLPGAVAPTAPLGPADILLGKLGEYPSSVERTVNFGTRRYKLSDAQYEDRQKTVGTAVRQRAERLLAEPGFQGLSPLNQQATARRDVTRVRDTAEQQWRDKLVREDPAAAALKRSPR